MTNDQIKEIALANGFKLKKQPNGEMELNPYVYEFARALIDDHEHYVKPDSITDIRNWFQAAKPKPTFNDAMTQYGCHIEEVCEMLDAMGDRIEAHQLTQLADWYKKIEYKDRPNPCTTNIELLDALADQIVTAVGVAYMMGFDIEGALKEVIRSNSSKMVNGKFIFDENSKIAKPDSYSEPDLTPFLNKF